MIWNAEDPAFYNADHIISKPMYDSDHVAVVWFGFTKGQSLKDHETSSMAIIQVLRGQIILNTAEEQVLQAGQTVQLQPRERHALTALEDSLVQLLLVPHPRYHSLAHAVGLSSG